MAGHIDRHRRVRRLQRAAAGYRAEALPHAGGEDSPDPAGLALPAAVSPAGEDDISQTAPALDEAFGPMADLAVQARPLTGECGDWRAYPPRPAARLSDEHGPAKQSQ